MYAVPTVAREGIGSPRAGGAGGCEQLDMGAGN